MIKRARQAATMPAGQRRKIYSTLVANAAPSEVFRSSPALFLLRQIAAFVIVKFEDSSSTPLIGGRCAGRGYQQRQRPLPHRPGYLATQILPRRSFLSLGDTRAAISGFVFVVTPAKNRGGNNKNNPEH